MLRIELFWSQNFNLFLYQHPAISVRISTPLTCWFLKGCACLPPSTGLAEPAASRSSRQEGQRESCPSPAGTVPSHCPLHWVGKGCKWNHAQGKWFNNVRKYFESSVKFSHNIWQYVLNQTSHTHQKRVWLIMSSSWEKTCTCLSPWTNTSLRTVLVIHSSLYPHCLAPY